MEGVRFHEEEQGEKGVGERKCDSGRGEKESHRQIGRGLPGSRLFEKLKKRKGRGERMTFDFEEGLRGKSKYLGRGEKRAVGEPIGVF